MMQNIKEVGPDELFDAITAGDTHNVIALIQANKEYVNCWNINGTTPLHFAVRAEKDTLLHLLLEAGANTNQPENENIGRNSALHAAAEKNLTKTVEKLLDYGGEIGSVNRRGFTCLHIAAMGGFAPMVKLLIARGADVNIRDKFGYTASYWAKREEHRDVVMLLPPPCKPTAEQIYEKQQEIWAKAGVAGGAKKTKKKKGAGGGKKKKKK